MIFLLCMMLMDDSNWTIKETGIFQPLEADEVIVNETGHVYILNFAEAHIQHFGADGQKIGNIGRKGKGPGEFTYPTGFFYSAGKIYILDLLTGNISRFNGDGTFEAQFSAPSRGLALAKTSKGWLYGNWGSLFTQNVEPGLFFADETFSEIKQIGNLKDGGFSRGMRTISGDDGDQKTTFTPISKRPLLRVSPDGNQIYLSDIDLFKIQVYDAEGNQKQVIQRTEPRLPFDSDWADEQLAEREKERESRGRSGKVDKQYPDTFPAIREIIIDPNGNLAVDRWRGRPDDTHHVVTVDPQGNEVAAAYSWDTLNRLAGIHNGNAYILIFDTENEEAGLVQVPIDKAETYVADHPIVYDGSGGHSISISL